jgi:hypothetical protein
MRSFLTIVAAVLALGAALVSISTGDRDVVPFFLLLTVVAAVLALLTVIGPWSGARRIVGRILALGWLVTAAWIGGLLVWYQVACACSSPEPVGPTPDVLGLPAAAYQLIATFGGAALVVVATFGGRRSSASPIPTETSLNAPA